MARSSHSIGEPLFPYDAKPEPPEETARLEEYRRRLAEYIKDPAFRAIEGFPIGSDENILALSDPPYYTACPNPFLPEILEQWQAERQHTRHKLNLPADDAFYRREPFAADVSEGKNDPIYNAHAYHTKVPHKAIMRYILHYTDPGDIVFDGFCGTGMTGVAAQLCGDKTVVEALGYIVKSDGRILDESGKSFSRLGARRAVLNDLSPAATFIAYNYNTPVDIHAFEKEAKRILQEVEAECGWMYETWHPNCNHPQRVKGKINYTIWSDVLVCPQCSKQMTYWDVAVDRKKDEVRDSWICPGCGSQLSKTPKSGTGILKADRVIETKYDHILNKTIRQIKQVPVLIIYHLGKNRYEKLPDREDLDLALSIENIVGNYSFPLVPMMFKGENWGDTWRSGYHSGITHVHHFFTTRNFYSICSMLDKTRNNRIKFILTGIMRALSKMFRWAPHQKHTAGTSGTLYLPSISHEYPIFDAIERRLAIYSDLMEMLNNFIPGNNLICTSDGSQNTNGKDSFDYIFIDPPFGDNLMYSELNFLWEAWLGVYTNNKDEAIVSKAQRKDLTKYQILMESCFENFYYLLKPNHWMTIEFHNSQNSVWNSLHEALLHAGFIIADVRTLDKKQDTFKQVVSINAVKQDLVISVFKPSEEFSTRFETEGGTEAGIWLFVRQFLDQLPMPDLHSGVIEPQPERMPYLIYDRLVAFHLVRGLTVPLSASEFYVGLGIRLLARDGMYFTSSQAADYDRLRLKAEKVEQLALFVTDEDTAIQWLRQALDPARGGRSHTYSDLQPEFLKQLHQEKYEKMPELLLMLEQNFLQDAAGRWYTPDPDKQADLDALRAKVLLHEFADYLKSKGKLKVFRSEAVRAGFSKAWKERDYETIVKVGERLPEAALQEDAKLKMYFDNALSRYQRGPHQEAML